MKIHLIFKAEISINILFPIATLVFKTLYSIKSNAQLTNFNAKGHTYSLCVNKMVSIAL
ncbi:hypothetical protein ZORO111902_04200 [Zobellia roscoffensis]